MRMGFVRTLVASIALIVLTGIAAPGSASAQESARPPSPGACSITDVISPECLKEFESWFRAELDYRRWMDLHSNRPVFSVVTGMPRARSVRPVAPSWLPGYCAGTFQADIASKYVCPRFNAVKDYDWIGERNHLLLAQLIRDRESPAHTSFKQRIHLDVGYAAAEFPSPHVYGLIGLHVGLVPVGPCEINVLPGSLILRVPDRANNSKLQPSVTLGGGGCRLGKFTIPGFGRQGVLHANLAQVHVIGRSSEEKMLGGSNLTMMGFSITMK
jgi:hypothetical protein